MQKMRGAEKKLTPADSAQLSHLLRAGREMIPEIMGRKLTVKSGLGKERERQRPVLFWPDNTKMREIN